MPRPYSGFPAPNVLGAPERFTVWRPEQVEAVNLASESDKRFVALCMPTGSGKSLAAVMAAVLEGKRAVILTSTKALQDQYTRDFAEIGMADVRGMGNYPCNEASRFGLPPRTRCDAAPCTGGMSCDRKGVAGPRGCDYWSAVAAASQASLVVTNYAYWLAMGKASSASSDSEDPGLIGRADILVLDEAHAAPDELCAVLEQSLTAEQLRTLPSHPDVAAAVEQWAAWAKAAGGTVAARAATLAEYLKREFDPSAIVELRDLRRLGRTLGVMSDISEDWCIEQVGAEIHASPINPGRYAEALMFRGSARVILLSATQRPKTAELLGIAAEELEFREWPSSFPVSRRPVIRIPTVRMHHKMTDSDKRIWAAKIDRIIAGRLDRKGIVHTVSYARRNFLVAHLSDETRPFVTSHDPGTTAAAIKRFKESAEGGAIVSPSLGTGYDFPYEMCEYQILAKVPWPDCRSAVMAARVKADPEYAAYLAMLELVQMAGRGMRSADDLCEMLVVDDFFGAMIRRYRHLAPRSFLDAVRYSAMIPAPPAKIRARGSASMAPSRPRTSLSTL